MDNFSINYDFSKSKLKWLIFVLFIYVIFIVDKILMMDLKTCGLWYDMKMSVISIGL